MLNLRKINLFHLIIFFFLLFTAKTIKAENSFFDIFDLQIEGRYIDYLVEDLNEDGL